jgi:hypothetical protein
MLFSVYVFFLSVTYENIFSFELSMICNFSHPVQMNGMISKMPLMCNNEMCLYLTPYCTL